jgi:hypothetical protein
MIQVYFFGPDLVAFIPEDGPRVVMTIDEAMACISIFADNRNGFKVFIRDETRVYSWATPGLVKQVVHDSADRILENHKTCNK